MYASQVKTSTFNGLSDTQPKVPVETYENKAVLQELARRSMNERVAKQENCSCKDSHNCNHSNSDCDNKTDCHYENECVKEKSISNCNNKGNGIFFGFDADDALIFLIIILMLTDKNDNNDILVPILLGLVLLS